MQQPHAACTSDNERTVLPEAEILFRHAMHLSDKVFPPPGKEAKPRRKYCCDDTDKHRYGMADDQELYSAPPQSFAT